MSKNFELLRNAGKPLDVFDHEEAVQTAEPFIVEATVPPQLEGRERDEIARLINRLFLVGPQIPRRVAFMGAEAGTGCSRVCARAAAALAASGTHGSVCVLDANLRTPSLHEHFGVENHYGLTDALQQGGSIRRFARLLSGGKLALITCGASVSSWQTLLSSPQMEARMAEFQQEFDHVLIDIPPLDLYPDSVKLAKLSDGLVLVVKAHSTRREVAQNVVTELKSANVRVLGAILNERSFPIPNALYYRL